MVRVSMLYPNKPGSRFDMDFYLHRHMPDSIDRLSKGPGFRGVAVDRGLLGAGPGTTPPFVAVCHYLFDTTENFLAAFGPHAEHLKGDIAAYTDIEPVIQFSELEIARGGLM